MKQLPRSAHSARDWRIEEIVPDFELEDLWALPTPGRREEFPDLVRGIAAADPAESLPRTARGLWNLPPTMTLPICEDAGRSRRSRGCPRR